MAPVQVGRTKSQEPRGGSFFFRIFRDWTLGAPTNDYLEQYVIFFFGGFGF
jgi:hypothetical protein